MRSLTCLLTLAAAGAALLGCDPSSSPTSLSLDPVTAALTTADHPSAGAIVEFDETPVLFFNFDAERGLLSAHVPSDLCSGAPLNIGDRQIVTTPSEIRQRFFRIQDGDSRVAIYRASSLNDLFSNFCGFLQGPTKVAEGTVLHTQTLSNASFAAHWGGSVEGVEGTNFHLSEAFQLTADAQDPGDASQWRTNVARVSLSPRQR